jgi:hypothetical protein
MACLGPGWITPAQPPARALAPAKRQAPRGHAQRLGGSSEAHGDFSHASPRYRFESECESDSPGAQNASAASAISARSEQGSGAETAETGPLHRNPLQRSAAEVAEAAEAESTPSLLDASHSSRSSALIGSGAEVMDDGEDDPAWGPRPTAQEET